MGADRYGVIRVEVKIGTRPLPTAATPALWRVGYLEVANRDARKFLDEDQMCHLRQQILDLASHANPRESETQDVLPIDQFYELRDKGGILGRINARVFFAILAEYRLIVVLACHKKESEGKTPNYVIVRTRNRLREAMKALKSQRAKKGG